MTTCPRCSGPLTPTPCGPYCEPCRFYFGPPLEGDPGTAPARDEHVFGDDSVMTPYGKMSGLPRGRGRGVDKI